MPGEPPGLGRAPKEPDPTPAAPSPPRRRTERAPPPEPRLRKRNFEGPTPDERGAPIKPKDPKTSFRAGAFGRPMSAGPGFLGDKAKGS